VHGGRVGEVVGRHVDGLDRGDRAGLGVGDAFFERRELGAHRRLVAQARRDLPEQARHLGAGLDEAKDVVDEQQHVAVLVVAEVLGHRQRRMADAKAAARQLVHLREQHHHVGQHAGGLHVTPQFLAFAATLAYAAEDTDAFFVPDHVVDHLGQQHRLADAGTAEQARLAATLERHQHVDHLDAGLEGLGAVRARGQRWRLAVHRAPLHLTSHITQRRAAVDGVAEHVEHARERGPAHWCHQRAAGVLHRHAASEALRRRERDAANVLRVALRHDFDDDAVASATAQQRADRRQAVVEAHVDHTATHRDHQAGVACGIGRAGVEGGHVWASGVGRGELARALCSSLSTECAAPSAASVRQRTRCRA